MGGLGVSLGFGSSKSKPKAVSLLTPEQEQMLKSLTGTVQSQLGQPAPSPPQMYVDKTAQEQQYQDWTQSAAMQKVLSGSLPYEFDDKAQNDLIQAQRNVSEDALTKSLDEIKAQQTGPGFYGSFTTKNLAEAVSQSRMQQALWEANQKMALEAERRGALTTAQDKMMVGAEHLYKSGEMERLIEQEKVNDALQRYLMGAMVDGQYDPTRTNATNLALYLLQPTKALGTESKEFKGGVGF